MKLGGELELRDVKIKTSTIKSRKLFLNLVLGMKPDVVSDLMRLFNMESVPMDLQVKPNPTDFPPSVHEHGEAIDWFSNAEPLMIEAKELR